jgi:hypothetical protein
MWAIQSTEQKGSKNIPDEIQRQFWQYRRLWLIIIVICVAARLILPHTPLLRGWEQKFCGAAIEIGKIDMPVDALKINNVEAANAVFRPKYEVPPAMANLDGPLLVAAWKCQPLGEDGACLRFLWKDEPVTLVMSSKSHKVNKTSGVFLRTGWSSYFIVERGIASALVGPFPPAELLSAWPYAGKFANSPQHK